MDDAVYDELVAAIVKHVKENVRSESRLVYLLYCCPTALTVSARFACVSCVSFHYICLLFLP
mgnify:CR=1 FL=1